MRLEPLYRCTFSPTESWHVELAGAGGTEGQGFLLVEGRSEGSKPQARYAERRPGYTRVMSESSVPKAVRADAVETGNGVTRASQQPSGPGNREGGGEWPDPDTPPTGLTEYDPQRVPVNMYETEGAVVLVLPLPGVMADDITIDIQDTRVHVNAAQRTPAEKDYIAHEWHYGPYERMVTVPEGFGGPASATFGNGQLALRIERGEGRDGKVVVQPETAGHTS